jgi:uncharacterized protein YecT (DUF1311 family)
MTHEKLTREKLDEIKKKHLFVSEYWGAGKDPQKDLPDYIETDRPPMINIPRWAAVMADELARQGKSEDEIYQILLEQSKTQVDHKPVIVAGPNGEVTEQKLTQDQQDWISYLGAVCRMAGVDPSGKSVKEMLDIVMIANVNVVPFEAYQERQRELRGMMEQELKANEPKG